MQIEIESTCIYNYIRPYLEEIEIANYKKGQYLTRADIDIEDIFFILQGQIQVEYTTKKGRSFLVDELSCNEFAGKISYLYDQHLYCDIIAVTDVSLLKIKAATFKKLKNSPEFLNVFFLKTSRRIYYMYKQLMMKDLFNSEELLSFHILKNSNDNIFIFKSMYRLCKILSISRKNLYNTINRFIERNYISKDKNSLIILDRNSLVKLSASIREFNETNESDCKF